MNFLANTLLYAVIALFAAGCSGQHEPAKLALEEINTAMQLAAEDAPKYLPDQTIFVQKEVAALNAAFEARDYATVVAESPTVLLDAEHLAGAATAKRQEAVMQLMHEWTALDASLPARLAAVKTRLDALAKVRHAPRRMDVTAIKASVAEVSDVWDKGQAAFDAGRIDEAVALLKEAKPKIDAAATALDLPFSEADQSHGAGY